MRITWDGDGESADAGGRASSALRDGEPSIAIRSEGDALVIGVWMMRPGEDKIVAQAAAPGAGAARPERGTRDDSVATGDMRARALLPFSLLLAARQPEQPSSAVQDSRAVRFPADVAPRNDILDRQPRADAHARRRRRSTPTSIVRSATGAIRSSLSRTPYSTERFPTAYDAAVYFAQRGYVYVFQDVRGRHESDGRLGAVLQRREGRLRHHRVGREAALVRRQGRDAGRLVSRAEPVARRAGGAAQPRHHLSDGGLDQHLPRLDHAQRRLAAVLQLRLGTGPAGIAHHAEPRARTRSTGVRAIHYDEVQWHLPLNTMQQLVGRHAKFYDDWLAHPDYDAYWKPLNVEEMFDKIAIPVHTFGGWFDIFSQGTLRGYVGMSQKGATETGAPHEPHRDRAVGTRPVAEVRRARFRPDRQRRRAARCSCAGTTTG